MGRVSTSVVRYAGCPIRAGFDRPSFQYYLKAEFAGCELHALGVHSNVRVYQSLGVGLQR
jgi:hypothetical protein